ncbi:MAG: hypothetical protein HY363_04040 [Candidatus Aenigmarchaeota archaeon]|nr:hypothetical protein [Candidatus Aenigmarchaeota archaeon]
MAKQRKIPASLATPAAAAQPYTLADIIRGVNEQYAKLSVHNLSIGQKCAGVNAEAARVFGLYDEALKRANYEPAITELGNKFADYAANIRTADAELTSLEKELDAALAELKKII